MCGRFNLRLTNRELQEFFHLFRVPEISPRYNIAPTQEVIAIRQNSDGQRVGDWLRWGLIPSWAKSPREGAKMINARSEGVESKPAFRAAFRRRRCLIPASGFYEWETVAGKKRPWHIHRASPVPLAFAGLWETWAGGEAETNPIQSCTILTTESNFWMRSLHDRLPVILPEDAFADWLNPQNQDPQRLLSLLHACPEDWLQRERVSPLVNNVRNETPACLESPAATDFLEATEGTPN